MAGKFTISWLVGICALLTVTCPPSLAVDVADTFSRTDDTELGVTETGGFSYLETGTTSGLGTDSAMIQDEELVLHGGEGEFGSGPGIAMIDVDLADIEMSADMRFSYPNDLFSDGGINTAGFVLRRPGTTPGFGAQNEGQVEVSMFPAGGFFIREIHDGALNLLYDDNPFGGVPGVDYGPPGSLPKTVGGLPFDFDEDGVLNDFEQFRLGANLAGNELSVTVNGEEVVNLNVSRSIPPGEGSLVGFYKNRHVGDDGTRDVVTPVFDNLSIGAPTDQLQAGDADQDFDFDQADIVRVLVGGKYLTGQAATWGDGDWNGAPGGSPGDPPAGDGLFNQTDIIAALAAGFYLKGPYPARDAATGALQGAQAMSVQLSQVPEPSALVMLSLGALVLFCSRAGRAGRRTGSRSA